MKAWCITDTAAITAQDFAAATWVFCKRISDNADVLTAGTVLSNYGGGHYVLENPNPTEDTIFQVVVTHDGTPYILEGAFSEGTSDAMFQEVLNRLLEQKVEGTIVTVAPTLIDGMVIYQYNDYPELEITLGPQWSTFLDGSYDIYLTISETLTGSTPVLEVEGSVYDQASARIQTPLTVEDTSINPGQYVWQVQLRKPGALPDDLPLSVKIPAHGKVHVRPALKRVIPPATP